MFKWLAKRLLPTIRDGLDLNLNADTRPDGVHVSVIISLFGIKIFNENFIV